MTTVTFSDDQWTKIRDFLREDPRAYVGQEANCRRFVEAMLWIARSGAQWRLLPSEYGQYPQLAAALRACLQKVIRPHLIRVAGTLQRAGRVAKASFHRFAPRQL